MNWSLVSGWASGAVAALVWLRSAMNERARRRRKEEIALAFVRDMATNHLPHIYSALLKIAANQGVELDETPMVQFVDLNGDKGH